MPDIPARRPPVRIVVLGSSVGFFVRPPGEAPGEAAYPEVLEELLWARGVEARVTNSSRWFLLATEAFRRLDDLVVAHQPHLVVVNFGLLECEPKVLPTRLVRWLYTWRPGGSVAARFARRLLVRPLTAGYRRLSPLAIRLLPVPRRVGERRFRLEIGRIVRIVRKERGAQVLLCTVNPPGQSLERVLPGTGEGSRRYSEIIREVAAESGPGVGVIDTARLVQREGVDEVLPDGIHYNARGHRLVAELLADEVVRRLAPHQATQARSDSTA
jgi:lysophospholipase L1-like esterase